MKNAMMTLLFLLFAGQTVWADEVAKEYDRLIVRFTDGSQKEIFINAKSSIHSYFKMENGKKVKVVDIQGDGSFYQYRRADILSMKFIESEISGLPPVFDWESEKDHLLTYENNVLKVHEQLEGEMLRIYDLSGRLLQTLKVPVGGIVPLTHLTQGVYSVTVKKYSIQIVKS